MFFLSITCKKVSYIKCNLTEIGNERLLCRIDALINYYCSFHTKIICECIDTLTSLTYIKNKCCKQVKAFNSCGGSKVVIVLLCGTLTVNWCFHCIIFLFIFQRQTYSDKGISRFTEGKLQTLITAVCVIKYGWGDGALASPFSGEGSESGFHTGLKLKPYNSLETR